MGGLVGRNELNNNDSTVYYSVTDSYWDSEAHELDTSVSARTTTISDNVVGQRRKQYTVLGYPTVDLQAPTGYEWPLRQLECGCGRRQHTGQPVGLRERTSEYPELRR